MLASTVDELEVHALASAPDAVAFELLPDALQPNNITINIKKLKSLYSFEHILIHIPLVSRVRLYDMILSTY